MVQNIDDEITIIARKENIDIAKLKLDVKAGRTVIVRNKKRDIEPLGIGNGLKTKINANFGTSTDLCDPHIEIEKLHMAVKCGVDTVMDLSIGGDIGGIRRRLLDECSIPLGTVPIYEAAIRSAKKGKGVVRMEPDELFEVIEEQLDEGVDFITVHCGVTIESFERFRRQGRQTNIVSRGGAFLVEWMIYNNRENPLYEQYDRLLELANKYGVTLSLGDGFRPGSLADATDRSQIQELIILGELVEQARKSGVKVIVEGPGHVPLSEIEMNIRIEKALTKDAPFYVLGPLVTDIAAGYDHINASIGASIAAMAGADFLCYVTPSEHLGLPTVEDVRQGVIALRIAGHAADIAKGIQGAREWDDEMSRARNNLDWERMIELSIDPDRAREIRKKSPPSDEEWCTMCGEYCAVKKIGEVLKLVGKR